MSAGHTNSGRHAGLAPRQRRSSSRRFFALPGRRERASARSWSRPARAGRQRGSERYYDLFDRYDGAAFGTTDCFSCRDRRDVDPDRRWDRAVVARRISRPITAVAEAATRISAGDRSVRVRPYDRQGEVGELVASFNRMAVEIETYQRERTVLTAGIAPAPTPLTILKGRLHALADGVIDPATGEVDRLLRQVEQLSRTRRGSPRAGYADAGELAIGRKRVESRYPPPRRHRFSGALAAARGRDRRDVYFRGRLGGSDPADADLHQYPHQCVETRRPMAAGSTSRCSPPTASPSPPSSTRAKVSRTMTSAGSSYLSGARPPTRSPIARAGDRSRPRRQDGRGA